jgi:hypothetical protein
MQAFLAFNAIAIPLVFGGQQMEGAKSLISAVGFLLHVGLTSAVVRSTELLKYWDESLRKLEQIDEDLESASRVPVFSGADFRRHQEWVRLQIYILPFGSGILLWFYATLSHFNLL